MQSVKDEDLVKVFGEDLAISQLISERYHILERQYKSPEGVVDIICRKDNDLYFVNVITSTYVQDKPYIIASDYKESDYRRAAEEYLKSNNMKTIVNCFFKKIEVVLNEYDTKLLMPGINSL